MAQPVYIKIEGSTQGLISSGASTQDSIGNRYQSGHEDEIMAQEVSHVITVPTDPQSGQPSGQRVHKPFSFTCSLNKAVPLLYNALTKGERLTTVEVYWYRTSSGGGSEHLVAGVRQRARLPLVPLREARVRVVVGGQCVDGWDLERENEEYWRRSRRIAPFRGGICR